MDSLPDWSRSQTFIESCQHALDGIRVTLERERNLKIQLSIGFVVLLVAIALFAGGKIFIWDMAILVLTAGLLLALELLNTAIEEIENFIHPEYHQAIKRSKDIASGAVFVASCAAIIVGLLLLGPPLWRILV